MIAISYRREDSLPITGRLYDRLQAKFGQQNVFMDFDSIPPGVDFREQIKRTIERSNIVIAVIGPRWLGEQSDSSRRIDDPADFVRLEIKYALKQGVPIIPLLIDNTLMPKPEKLPPELEALAFRNALPLDSGIDFHTHAERLINGICGLVDVGKMQGKSQDSLPIQPHSRRQSKTIIWRTLALAAVVGVGLLLWFQGSRTREEKVQRSQEPVATPQSPPSSDSQPAQTETVAPQSTAVPSASVSSSSRISPAQPSAARPSQPLEANTVPPQPLGLKTISIENCTVSIDGVLVQNVEAVLGKPERVEATHHGAEVDIWDSIGVRIYPNEAGKPYLRFEVFLNDDESKITSCPEKTYQGELLIEGFSVLQTTNIKTLNASLGSKALLHSDTYGGGHYPVYTGQYGAGGIEILCDAAGVIQTVSVLPGGLPKKDLQETSEQRSARIAIERFLDAVKKGDLKKAFQTFQHTPNDPKGFTLEAFASFVRQNEAFSQIRSYRITVTNDSWGMVFWGRVEITCSDGRQREATISMLKGEKDFQIDHIEGAKHGFPSDENAVLPSNRVEATSSITEDMVREFVKKFVAANQSYPPNNAVALYAPKVRYHDEGERDPGYIRKDLEKDHKRWPIRQDNIEGDIKVSEKAPGREYGASFTLKVYVESPERHEWVKGQFAVVLSVTVVEGEPKISAIKETVLHRETGKFPGAQESNKASPTPGMPLAQTPSLSSSNTSNVLVGTWEGDVYLLDPLGKAPPSRVYSPLRLVINAQDEVARTIFTQGSDPSSHSQRWSRTAARTLTLPSSYGGMSISVHRDGKTATYVEKWPSETIPGKSVFGESRGTLRKKN